MSLADDLASPPAYRGTRACTFAAWLQGLAPAERDAVRAAVARHKDDPLYWSTPKLHARLREEGWGGSDAVVYAHRTGSCLSCRSQTT